MTDETPSSDSSDQQPTVRPMGRRLALLVLVAVVAFVSGVFSTALETFPYPQLLDRPFQALRAYRAQSRMLKSLTSTDLWVEPRYSSDQKGVLHYDSQRAFDGFTLYTTHETGATLIDMQGNVVHEWNVPFRQVWQNPPHVDDELPPEKYIFWRRAELLSNGDVVANYTTTTDTPYGYGLARIDKDSNVVWKFADNTHHDFDLRPDGSVFTITHGFRNTTDNPVPDVPQFPNLILKDDLVHLSPDGNEVRRVSLLEALVNSKYHALLQMFYPRTANPASGATAWDPLHTNTVQVIDSDFAEHHDFAEPGQVMVSFRGFDAIAVVDMEAETVVWMSRGFWADQHDPDPLPNGNIMLYDNKGFGGPGGPSRVVEYDPSTNAIVWSYGGTLERPLSSVARASQQPLPSGNILITSSQSGRLLEVTRSGEIVWDFVNPERLQRQGKNYIATVCSGQRVARNDLTFRPDSLANPGAGADRDSQPTHSPGRDADRRTEPPEGSEPPPAPDGGRR